jgi:hypothetical protein
MNKSAPQKPSSREEIRVVYQQGEELVIELVEGLVEWLGQLETRIEGLENQQKQHSRNSSKPLSSDGYGKRTMR